jgi:hypothetical protein
MAIVSLSVYYWVKIKLLSKYYIKKRYLIIAMLLTLILPVVFLFITHTTKIPSWFSMIEMILFTVIFLIYLEILKIDRTKKNKPIVGKPKPNPNRVRNQK